MQASPCDLPRREAKGQSDLLSLHPCTNADPQLRACADRLRGCQARGRWYATHATRCDRIKIGLYPFNDRPFNVHYAHKQLATRDFSTEVAFREAYYAADSPRILQASNKVARFRAAACGVSLSRSESSSQP